jgi:hypothetical protein
MFKKKDPIGVLKGIELRIVNLAETWDTLPFYVNHGKIVYCYSAP